MVMEAIPHHCCLTVVLFWSTRSEDSRSVEVIDKFKANFGRFAVPKVVAAN